MSEAPIELYVLPDRWDHAISAANRSARRNGVRYQVRWFRPRGCWVVQRAPSQPATRPTAERDEHRGEEV